MIWPSSAIELQASATRCSALDTKSTPESAEHSGPLSEGYCILNNSYTHSLCLPEDEACVLAVAAMPLVASSHRKESGCRCCHAIEKVRLASSSFHAREYERRTASYTRQGSSDSGQQEQECTCRASTAPFNNIALQMTDHNSILNSATDSQTPAHRNGDKRRSANALGQANAFKHQHRVWLRCNGGTDLQTWTEVSCAGTRKLISRIVGL